MGYKDPNHRQGHWPFLNREYKARERSYLPERELVGSSIAFPNDSPTKHPFRKTCKTSTIFKTQQDRPGHKKDRTHLPSYVKGEDSERKRIPARASAGGLFGCPSQ